MRRFAIVLLVVGLGLSGCASQRELDGNTGPFVTEQMKQHGVVQ